MAGTGTALVHPSTARLTPQEQAKGVYTYRSPEQQAKDSVGVTEPALADRNGTHDVQPRRVAVKRPPVDTSVYDAVVVLVRKNLTDEQREKLAVELLQETGWDITL